MKLINTLAVVSLTALLAGCIAVPVGQGYYPAPNDYYAADPGYYSAPGYYPAPAYYPPSAYYGPSFGIGVYSGWGGRGWHGSRRNGHAWHGRGHGRR